MGGLTRFGAPPASTAIAVLAVTGWECLAILVLGPRVGDALLHLALQIPVILAVALLARGAYRTRPSDPTFQRSPWSHHLFAETQALSHTGSWRWSVEADRVEWSTELYRIHGLDPATPVDYRTFLDAVHPEDRLRVHAAVQEALAEKRPFAYEERIVRPDGTVRHVLGRGRVLANAEGEWMVGVCMDVTDRVESRRALRRKESELARAQRMEAIGRMAAGVAHDFNNLLAAIKGFTDLVLQDPDLAARHRVSLEEVSGTAEQAGAMVRRLLTLGRTSKPALESVDVNDRLREMRRKLESLCGDVPIEIATTDGLGPARVDPAQLEQVVVNLVVNARDASPEATPVTVRTRRGGSPGTVRIEVCDRGEGIPADVAPHVFEPFFTTKGRGGTGLGLATVHAIVDAHGGEVGFEERPDGGTVFAVDLPVIDADADEPETISV